jgi:hypothetical protein
VGEKKKEEIKNVAKLNIPNCAHFIAKEFCISSYIDGNTIHTIIKEWSLMKKSYRVLLAHNYPNNKLHPSSFKLDSFFNYYPSFKEKRIL